MRALSTAEVSVISGGFSPMEWALGVGFVSLTVSCLSFSTPAAFSGAAPYALSGAALVAFCVSAAVSASAAFAVSGMLVMGWYSAAQGSGTGPSAAFAHCMG